jgi:hypothetical protein
MIDATQHFAYLLRWLLLITSFVGLLYCAVAIRLANNGRASWVLSFAVGLALTVAWVVIASFEFPRSPSALLLSLLYASPFGAVPVGLSIATIRHRRSRTRSVKRQILVGTAVFMLGSVIGATLSIGVIAIVA